MNSKHRAFKAFAAAGLALVMTTGVALASIGTGTVTADSLRLRSDASVGSSTLALAPKGAAVTLVEQVSDSWYKVLYGDEAGYMSADWLTVALEEPSDAASNAIAEEPEPVSEAVQGVVTASSLNVRSGAGTSYGRVGTLKKGAAVTILDSSISGWYQISSGDLTGYVSSQWISLDGDAGSSEPATGVVTTSVLNVRSGAGTSYSRVGALKAGASVTILDDSISGWYQISSGSLSGYVSSDYVALAGDASASSLSAAAFAMAQNLLGCRYAYGATGPTTFDCSGLFYYIYRQLGYPIARGSSSQYNQSGYFVTQDQVQPGDLVFFFDPRFDSSGGRLPTTHVGMYAGNGQFIHASTTTYRVQYDDLFTGYYSNYIVGYKRMG